MKALIFFCLFFHLMTFSFGFPSQTRMGRRSTETELASAKVVVLRSDFYTDKESTDASSESCRFNQMTLHKFHGQNTPKCMDGTAASFYFLQREESRDWVIYLPGGSFCTDKESCSHRLLSQPELTSSRYFGQCKEGMGILSTSEMDNPFLHKSNMVFIPYCSSDLWSGTAKNVDLIENKKLNFMGSKILQHTIRVLARKFNLLQANQVFVAGSSAGGLGVLLNVDRIQRYLKSEQSGAIVKGIADSAWYLPPERTDEKDCSSSGRCSMVEMIKKGLNLWRSRVNEACETDQKQLIGRDGVWKCFLSPVASLYNEVPSFIIQSIFDTFQLHTDGINFSNWENPQTHVNYLKNHHKRMIKSLQGLKGIFAPACITHSFLQDDQWQYPTVNHIEISEAIECWSKKIDFESHESTTTENPKNQMKELEYNQNDSSFNANETQPIESEYYIYESYSQPIHTVDVHSCASRLINSCSIPQCSEGCPILQFGQGVIPTYSLHTLLYPEVERVCDTMCRT